MERGTIAERTNHNARLLPFLPAMAAPITPAMTERRNTLDRG
ncbi:MAG: hypothetical protein Q8J64_06715 [Thermodesulfovibrionales bacterium]|nr:hypothetical protein [Thermodesulfovibrionales bacterium]